MYKITYHEEIDKSRDFSCICTCAEDVLQIVTMVKHRHASQYMNQKATLTIEGGNYFYKPGRLGGLVQCKNLKESQIALGS